MNRKEQKELRRRRILQVGLDLFITQGYYGTKIADIAEASDMSVGLLFHYFDSKEALYETILQLAFQQMKFDIVLEESPLRTIEKILSKAIQGIHQDPMLAKMFVLADQAHYLVQGDKKFAHYMQDAQNFLMESEDIIRQGQLIGEIRVGNPEALSIVLWNAVQGYAQHLVQNPQMPKAEIDWFLAIIKKEPKENA